VADASILGARGLFPTKSGASGTAALAGGLHQCSAPDGDGRHGESSLEEESHDGT
jgi:hypothetical protein